VIRIALALSTRMRRTRGLHLLSRCCAGLLALQILQAQATPELRPVKLDEVGGGSLLLRDSDGYRQAPTQQTDATIRIAGPIARTVLQQHFSNPGDDWAEALYAFPLPEDAAVDHLRLRIGERVIEGDIQARAQARQTYETAAREGRQTALVEQHRPNLFTTAVANIPPHADIVVELEFQQSVQWTDDRFSLRLPLAITPRYTPGAIVDQPVSTDAQGWAVLPGELPNASFRVADDSERGPLNPVHIEVELDAGFALASVESQTHRIVTTADGARQTIRLADADVRADHDFVLGWVPEASARPHAAFFTEHTAEGDYGLLLLMPPSEAFDRQPRIARETIFIIDTSGSMGGQSLRAAQAALDSALARLSPGDSFNVIEFNSTADALFRSPRPATRENVTQAQIWIERLEATGGTEMRTALDLAFAQPRALSSGLRQIVFITDGAVGNEAELLQVVHDRLGDSRLFTVGIGTAPNSYFMTEAASVGRGSFSMLAHTDDVEADLRSLFAQLEHPALTDVTLDLPVASDRLPAALPDLYRGQPLSVVMKLDAIPEQASASGRIGADEWRSTVTLHAAEGKRGLGVLWARHKIGAIERQALDGVPDEQIREQALPIALQHHLVSRFTSLVAVDRTPVRPADAALESTALPNEIPAGWEMASVSMANTATPSPLLLLCGALLVLLGGALRPRGGLIEGA